MDLDKIVCECMGVTNGMTEKDPIAFKSYGVK